jgi:hypothetical protein
MKAAQDVCPVRLQSVKEPQVSEGEICGSSVYFWKTGQKTLEI